MVSLHMARSGVTRLLGCELIGWIVWEAMVVALVVDRHVSSSAAAGCGWVVVLLFSPHWVNNAELAPSLLIVSHTHARGSAHSEMLKSELLEVEESVDLPYMTCCSRSHRYIDWHIWPEGTNKINERDVFKAISTVSFNWGCFRGKRVIKVFSTWAQFDVYWMCLSSPSS